jgi:hypothetical protein
MSGIGTLPLPRSRKVRFTNPGTPFSDAFRPVFKAAHAVGDSGEIVEVRGAKVPSSANFARLGKRPASIKSLAVA